MVFPIGLSLPNQLWAASSVNIKELGESNAVSVFPIVMGKSKTFSIEESTKMKPLTVRDSS
jgi:hypothetical protein